MSTPEPPSNAGATPAPPTASTPAGAPAAEAAASAPAAPAAPAKPADPRGTAGYKPKPPPQPLTGWRSAFEHTGIPRSWLTAKPRLPSRKWCIFLSTVGAISYLYYDDRKKAKQIRQEYIDKVQFLSQQPTVTALDMPRKVKVYGARWPDDDESDRALRYFRKYVKPYLVAAAIDYDQVHAPLYGSIARIVRGEVVKKRREALGLQAPDDPVSLAALDPAAEAQREVEGGTILIGRPALKEYLWGMRAGWTNGVDPWIWEDEVEKEIKDDGFFDEPVLKDTAAGIETPTVPDATPEVQPEAQPETVAAPPSKSSYFGGLFSRSSAPPAQSQAGSTAPPTSSIPERLHTPPTPLPPQPPILLVPFTKYLGFKQIPYMIYNFFTESKRVREGAEAAYALIMNETRPMTGPEAGVEHPDSDFGASTEAFYKKNYDKVPEINQKAKDAYYKELAKRLESARQFARGEREITEDEKRSDKPVTTEDDLRAERKKRELRWAGGLEGWNIVRSETPVAWDPMFAGWLRVFDVKDRKD